MLLTGGALRRLEEITPAGMTARLDITLTDEPPLAQAVVIITAVPGQQRLSRETFSARAQALTRRSALGLIPRHPGPPRQSMKANSARTGITKRKSSGGVVDTIKTVVYAVLIALVVRTVAV